MSLSLFYRRGVMRKSLCRKIKKQKQIYPDFDSCNLKTLIYQGIKSLFFVYSTTVSLRINLGIFIPKALNIRALSKVDPIVKTENRLL